MHEDRIQEIIDHRFDLVILDEMHHITEDNKWGTAIGLIRQSNPQLLYLGLSATPQRTDKVPFGWLYQDTRCVCVTMTLFDAIERGWLVKLRVLRIDIEVGGVDIKRNPNGEIAKSEPTVSSRPATENDGAPCTADAVRIGVNRIRHIKVDDMREVVYINSTGSNIGGHQNGRMSFLELGQYSFPPCL